MDYILSAEDSYKGLYGPNLLRKLNQEHGWKGASIGFTSTDNKDVRQEFLENSQVKTVIQTKNFRELLNKLNEFFEKERLDLR